VSPSHAGTTRLGLADATCDKNIEFVGPETTATNGYVQVIDTVMFPPGECVCDAPASVRVHGDRATPRIV
jgi:hypothetical protein